MYIDKTKVVRIFQNMSFSKYQTIINGHGSSRHVYVDLIMHLCHRR